jgi:hypothetical protein
MKHVIQHGLDPQLARKATRKALESYQERFAQYDPKVHWASDDRADVSFAAKGVTLNGAIEVGADDIAIDLDVPFILKPFKKKATGVIDKEIRDWIGRAKRGELDG